MFEEYKWAIVFYSVVILLLIAYRKNFDMHGIVALYRTKVGLASMNSISSKHREWVKLLGYIGIGVGFVGLVFIVWVMFKNFFDLLFIDGAQSAVTPVIPGVPIPGTGFTIPLISGWISLFVVIVIHEFSHGVVARAHKLKVKSSGIFFMGPIMGAFVEPDEKELSKASDVVQYSILAAGPFSNVLTAAVVVLLLTTIAPPIQMALVEPTGFELISVTEDFPAAVSGLEAGMIITSVNGAPVYDRTSFVTVLRTVLPGHDATVTVDGGKEYTVTTTTHPDNALLSYVGVVGDTKTSLRDPSYELVYDAYRWVYSLLQLLGMLSLGIGLINLFPIFVTDGAKILHVAFMKIGGKKGFSFWKHTNIFCLLVLLMGVFYPVFQWMFGL